MEARQLDKIDEKILHEDTKIDEKNIHRPVSASYVEI